MELHRYLQIINNGVDFLSITTRTGGTTVFNNPYCILYNMGIYTVFNSSGYAFQFKENDIIQYSIRV